VNRRASGAATVSLAEQAYGVLEQKLVALELPPGEIVSEGQLIALTGLGRTPVREAMQRLAQQDLIQVMPRKGLKVTPVSSSAMLQILETRRALERVIVHRAALNARDEQRGSLAAIARDLATAYDNFEACALKVNSTVCWTNARRTQSPARQLLRCAAIAAGSGTSTGSACICSCPMSFLSSRNSPGWWLGGTSTVPKRPWTG